MPERPLLDVVIVNWNAGRHLAACVDALLSSETRDFDLARVVVVDNASSDGSADFASARAPLMVLRNKHNVGFAAACNQGARDGRGDYLLFLNPDVVVRPGTLAASVGFMESEGARGVGILGVRLVDQAGRAQRCCARFPSAWMLAGRSAGLDLLLPGLVPPHFLTEFDHLRSRPVDQVMGAFFLMRAPVFFRLGGFDERFFVYWEDVDLALRAKRAGWSTYFLADTEAFHAGGGTTDSIRPARLFYSLRSRLQFACKHFSPPAALLVAASALTVEPVARVAQSLARHDLAGAADIIRGYAMLARRR